MKNKLAYCLAVTECIPKREIAIPSCAGCRRIGKKPGIVILNGAKRSEGSCLKLVVTLV